MAALFGVAFAFISADPRQTREASAPKPQVQVADAIGGPFIPAGQERMDRVEDPTVMQVATTDKTVRPTLPQPTDMAAPAPTAILPQPAQTDAPDTTVATANPVVAVAQTEADVAALEKATAKVAEHASESPNEIARLEAAGGMTTADVRQDVDPSDTAAIAAVIMRPARVLRWVNMRAAPQDGAKTVAIVPSEARVQAETGCGWCAVEFKGKRGFVYKSFLRPL